MRYCNDEDDLAQDGIEHSERKPLDQRASRPRLFAYVRPALRRLLNGCHRSLDRIQELSTQTSLLLFVPVSRVAQLGTG